MTTDDPHDHSAAAEEQPAGEASTERAELLGSTALTARVRCPCGKRQDVDREDWQWDGVAACTRCGRGILEHSLRLVGPEEARSMAEARRPTDGEQRTLRRIELSLRDFMLRYGEHPRWYWSPPTNRMAGDVGRLLSELDESRHHRGAPPVTVVDRGAPDDDRPEGGQPEEVAWGGGDDDDGTTDDEEYEGEEALDEGEE